MGLDIGLVHEVRSVAACRSSGEQERPRYYGMPTFHREPIYNAAYDASWWPEVGPGDAAGSGVVYAGPLSHRRLHLNSDGPFIETAPTMGDRLKRVKR